MNRMRWVAVLSMTLLLLAACSQESRVTGGFNSGVLSGQVSMNSADIALEGVAVKVRGTGLTTYTNADGRFQLVGVPDSDLEVVFSRPGDAVEATLSIGKGAANDVKVALTSNGNGTSGRRRVGTRPNDLQIEGRITEATATSITVSDSNANLVTAAITPTTIIRHGQTTLTPAQLTVGLRVHVKANRTETDSLVAIEIIASNSSGNDDDGDEEQYRELRGTVTAASPTSVTLTLGDGTSVTIAIDNATVIRHGRQVLSAGAITVGSTIEVKALVGEGGALLAIRINVEGGEEAEFTGTVASISGSVLTVTRTDGTTTTVQTDANTRFQRRNETITIADIAVGDTVQVSGTQVDASTVLARKVKLESSDDDGDDDNLEAVVKGTVTAKSGTTLTVQTTAGPMTVLTDDNTRFFDRNLRLTIADVETGDTIQAEGTRIDATTLKARNVKVESSGDDDGGGEDNGGGNHGGHH